MNVEELIEELNKFPKDLPVMAAGEQASKVVMEFTGNKAQVKIYQPWYMKDRRQQS